ncbi:MAG: hypothetical protein ACRCTU_07750 [Zoogloea sp.]|uniref:hypothetical protein n=1 Tax=Zoogloea sp. TaxID=49181 RepID=UPI003F32FC47
MASKAVQARARNRNGDELTLQAHESDALTLPVEQLERLHNFRPDLVDFVITQTQAEAEHRRRNDTCVNRFIFIERITGQLAAVFVAALGIGGGIYAGLHGEPVLGGTIASITIGTLAVAFLGRTSAEERAKSAGK